MKNFPEPQTAGDWVVCGNIKYVLYLDFSFTYLTFVCCCPFSAVTDLQNIWKDPVPFLSGQCLILVAFLLFQVDTATFHIEHKMCWKLNWRCNIRVKKKNNKDSRWVWFCFYLYKMMNGWFLSERTICVQSVHNSIPLSAGNYCVFHRHRQTRAGMSGPRAVTSLGIWQVNTNGLLVWLLQIQKQC